MEGVVRNIGNFSRFLEAIGFSQAAVLNLANVARECHVNRASFHHDRSYIIRYQAK
jgi:uncharacterized protein